MLPTFEQVQRAAFFRWQNRGGLHGSDRDDWVAAEQELLFALNYEVICRYRLDGAGAQFVGSTATRRCRFCERAVPDATFETRPLAIPGFLGNTTLFANDQCDDCQAFFAESIDGDFEAFAHGCLAGPAGRGESRGNGNGPTSRDYRPLAAFKGLTKLALAILPEDELAYVEDALEWVSNPDHDCDAGTFEGLTCYVHTAEVGPSSPWTALARRVDLEVPLPYLLFFLGTEGVTFEIAVPLCVRDEDLDGSAVLVPRVANPTLIGQEFGAVRCATVQLTAVRRRDAVLALVDD